MAWILSHGTASAQFCEERRATSDSMGADDVNEDGDSVDSTIDLILGGEV